MAIGAIIGGLGAGKTLFLVNEIYFYLMKRHSEIYTNFHLKLLEHVQLSKPEEIITTGLQRQNIRKLCAIDEGYLWFDALEKSSNKQMFYRNLINITRKMNYNVLFTTQSLGQIYYRIRLLMDFLVKPIYNKKHDYLKVTLYRQSEFGGFIPSRPYKIKNISKMFKFYDTFEIINDFIYSYYEVDTEQTTLPL